MSGTDKRKVMGLAEGCQFERQVPSLFLESHGAGWSWELWESL